MHERKIEMATRVGGFIGLPGGFGTFEEVIEIHILVNFHLSDALNELRLWK
jgi:predicted Rossmann-fold nucleotide-binding protein